MRRFVASELLIVLTLFLLGVPAEAQDATPTDWQQLPLRDAVVRLFTPRSGAFFAQVQTALYRSDDAGASWQSVPLPPLEAFPSFGLAADQRGKGQIAVDPSNHQTIYAAGTGGLHKTADGGRTWQLVQSSDSSLWVDALTGVVAVAVSPVTSQLVYVFQADGHFARSTDAGQTWQDLPSGIFGPPYGGAGHGGVNGCRVAAMLLPHPQAANRLILSTQCHAGRDQMQPSSGNVDESFDQGNTRKPFLRPDWAPAYLGFMVGGQGAAPTRFYLTTDLSSSTLATRLLNSRLVRSDDDGATWTEVTGVWDDPGDESYVQIGALVADIANANTLYVGLNQFSRVDPPRLGYVRTRSWVRTSGDGGQSWADVGCADLGGITDLAIGIDGQNLYAGTQGGVWGLPLVAGSAPSVTCDASIYSGWGYAEIRPRIGNSDSGGGG